jgi:peptidoglycan-N-acetylglucosamine deacetylase
MFKPPPSPPVPPGRDWTPAPLVRASCWLHAGAALGLAAHPPVWPWAIGAVLANHVALGIAGLLPRNRLLGPNLLRLPEEARRRGEVALTFDDGPDPEVTPRVLELLEAHGASASFFLIGRRAARHPALARELVRRGHSAENHTDRHLKAFAALPFGAMRREVAAGQRAIADASGEAPRFFRPPVGLRSPLLDPVLAGIGLAQVAWTRRGFDTVRREPAAIARRLGRGLAAGDILLLHDGNVARMRDDGRTPVVLEALPVLLRQIAASGLRAVSLPQAMPAATGPVAAGAGRGAGAALRARASCASR